MVVLFVFRYMDGIQVADLPVWCQIMFRSPESLRSRSRGFPCGRTDMKKPTIAFCTCFVYALKKILNKCQYLLSYEISQQTNKGQKMLHETSNFYGYTCMFVILNTSHSVWYCYLSVCKMARAYSGSLSATNQNSALLWALFLNVCTKPTNALV